MNRETALHWVGDLEAELEGVKAQLAEAVRLLRDSECHYRHVWYEPHISEVADFLARYAQAEQQEAKPLEPGVKPTKAQARAALATQPAARGAPVAIKLPPSPYVGPEGYCDLTSYEQGALQGRCDMWELIRKMNTPPAAAHGDKPK